MSEEQEDDGFITLNWEDEEGGLSEGEQLAGFRRGHSEPDLVEDTRSCFAEVIDNLLSIRASSQHGSVARTASIAITETQTACMWAVRAAYESLTK